MKKLANKIPIDYGRDNVLDKIDKWENNGVGFFSSDKVEKKVLFAIWKSVTDVQTKLAIFKKEHEPILDELEKFYPELLDMMTNMTLAITNHEHRISNLEERNDRESITNNKYYKICLPIKNANFVNCRKSLSEDIKTKLQDLTTKIVSITGLGGIGKKSLALDTAWCLTDNFPGGIFWMTSDPEGELNEAASKLLKRIELPIDRKLKAIDELSIFLENIKEKCLVIVDNLDCDEIITSASKIICGRWLNNDYGKLLVTSRLEKKTFATKISHSHFGCQLSKFTSEQGIAFFNDRLPKNILKDTNQAELKKCTINWKGFLWY